MRVHYFYGLSGERQGIYSVSVAMRQAISGFVYLFVGHYTS